jgi:hypothetical protein
MAPLPPLDPVLAKIVGTWGATNYAPFSCSESPHNFTISQDGQFFTNRNKEKLYAGGEGTNESVSRILTVRGNVVTMFNEREMRLTESGDPAVWSLVLVNDDRFYWRRTDWKADFGTAPYERCK